MSSMTGRVRSRRRALTAATVVAALTVAVAGCGPEEDNAEGKPSAPATTGDSDGSLKEDLKDLKDDLGLPDKLPENLPTSLEELEKWRDGEWKNWDKDKWLREAREFINPIIEGHWDRDGMKDADGNDREVDDSDIPSGGSDGTGEDEGVSDPAPDPVQAKNVQTPYTENAGPFGKVLMDTPKGQMVCSGTIVKDPRNPGRSNLVATAGHCVHAGKSGGWYRNVVFVPHFNPKGLSEAALNKAPRKDIAPHGVWWAKHARTTNFWIEHGGMTGGEGAPQDFAMMKVQPENKSDKSLEETVGDAAPVNFGTPRVKALDSLVPTGYPASPPFDGLKMYECTDKPGRLSMSEDQPTMYRVGCTMNGGSSGGGWLSPKGELLSVTSIGPVDGGWLAGPRLGKEAKGVFDTIGKEK